MSTNQYDLARRGSLARDPQVSSSRTPGATNPVAPADMNIRVVESKLIDITDIETQFGDVEMTIRTSNRQLPNRRYKDSPLILRQRVAYNGQPKSTQLEISSQPLRYFLSDILNRYPLLDQSSEVLIIPKPYEPLFHNAAAIHKYIRAQTADQEPPVEMDSGNESTDDLYPSEVASVVSHSVEQHRASQIGSETDNAFQAETGHFLALKSFMDINLKHTRSEYGRLVQSQKMISFEILWTLFKPGTRVIEQQNYFVQAYLVESSFLTEQNGVGIQVVDCVSWDYDGTYYGPKTTRFNIESFPGAKRASALPIYPIRFHDEFESPSARSHSEMLTERGNCWRHYLKNAYCCYQSTAWINRDQIDGNNSTKDIAPTYVSGPIILDYKTYCQENPSQTTVLSFSNATRRHSQSLRHIYKDDSAAEYPHGGNEDLTSPALVRGFALNEKAWGLFLVDKVRPWEHNHEIEQMLVLKTGVKDLIAEMVSGHDPDRNVDFVSGKGRGLIFLLQGPPGCGKTLTAEAMASRTEKPLYTLTGGFLGTDADKVNKELRMAFDRAKAWDAIILIDEADVYLASRENLDLQRTLLVSVFLHRLEYFEGIMFMTTNQAKAIDVAFQSRITVTIPYPQLERDGLSQVLRALIDHAEQSNKNLYIENAILEEMDEYLRGDRASWINGRALKSLVKSAISLASSRSAKEGEGPITGQLTLSWKYFVPLLDQAEALRNERDEILRGSRR